MTQVNIKKNKQDLDYEVKFSNLTLGKIQALFNALILNPTPACQDILVCLRKALSDSQDADLKGIK